MAKANKPLTGAQVAEALKTWHSLHSCIMQLDEGQVEQLFDIEKKHQKRQFILKRLHSRLTRLRVQRERKELAG